MWPPNNSPFGGAHTNGIDRSDDSVNLTLDSGSCQSCQLDFVSDFTPATGKIRWKLLLGHGSNFLSFGGEENDCPQIYA